MTELKNDKYIRCLATGEVGMVKHYANGAVEYPEFMFDVTAQATDFEYVEIHAMGTEANFREQLRDAATQKGIVENKTIALLEAVKKLKGLLELTAARPDCPDGIKLSIAQSPRITEANAALRFVADL